MIKKTSSLRVSGAKWQCATHVEISVQHNSSNLSNDCRHRCRFSLKKQLTPVHVRFMKHEQELINVTYTSINEGQ